MMRRFTTGLFVVAAMAASACSSSGSAPVTAAPATTTPVTTAAPTTAAPTTAPDPAQVAAIESQLSGMPPGCDPLDMRHCLLPYPSNAFVVNDPSTDTGKRVAFPAGSAPTNVGGVTVDVAEWNRNDGFSPNTPILTHVPGLDPKASNLPPWTDLEASLAATAPVVLIDAGTGTRVPLWAEPDSKADSEADQLLAIHPAVPLAEGHTYVVGLRNLVGTDGAVLKASPVFTAYRDGYASGIGGLAPRVDAMEADMKVLTAGGINRHDLQLAWDFTVASQRSISERMLHIRDDALAALGSAAPEFTVTAVTPNPDDNIARKVEGTFTVPNYLTGDGGPGNRFFYGDGVVAKGNELPQRNGTLKASFICNISAATVAGSTPAHLVEYGHGLLGSNDEVGAGNVRDFANEHNVVFCATKWAGMSDEDVGNAAATLGNFSNFPTMADRLQQGVLNQIFLGRLMLRPDGLASNSAFQRPDGSSLIDTKHLDYDGNSQGGIMGMMLTAVSPDIERSVLGVVGMNYSMLLERSVDFSTYEAIMKPAYPNELDRVMAIALAQMLWDRGEGAGYVQHLTTNPYAGTAAKQVLLDVAFGDWQVTELSAMVAARAMGATVHRPVTAPGRSREKDPGWGLSSTVYPSTGSALVIWDSGSDPIPVENAPPKTSRDPHEDPRADPDVRRQKAAFLFDDTLIDVCQGGPCTADKRL
ncbi:MAG: hypothetical protein WCO88_14515 [Actinomycetota bacterium]